MLNTDHVYRIQLDDEDPRAEQPAKITTPLKPHQRAALHKAMIMERTGSVHYDIDAPEQYLHSTYAHHRASFRGKMRVRSNMGILGDVVGYGKTLTALSIIASTGTDDFHIERESILSSPSYHYSHFKVHMEAKEYHPPSRFINTTLVVVPRGPVFVQWVDAIQRHTTLSVLALDGLPQIRRLPSLREGAERIKAEFEKYDVVLVKNTSLKTLMDHYGFMVAEHPIVAFDRIMIDEAHEIMHKVPLLQYRFLWLISGTYRMLQGRTSGRSTMSLSTRSILCDQERMNLLLLAGEKNFVLRSFAVPPPIEKVYMCHLPPHLAVVTPFVNPAVLDRINAADIAGAIREMGGSNSTEKDLVKLVTQDIEREIRNQERTIAFVQAQEVAPEYRAARLDILNRELQRLRDKKDSLMERVTALDQKTCPICFDSYEKPIMLPCTHVFCGQCLIGWMKDGRGRVCPQCRTSIRSDKMVAIVHEGEGSMTEMDDGPKILGKEDTLVNILQNKPDGKFLVFSRLDSTFYSLAQRLMQMQVSYAEMKGSTCQMMRTLERFRDGEIRVLLMNSYHTGSGIDISMATDIILYHDMGLQNEQCTGRGQRVGRTTPLHIHYLCYPHEFAAVQQAPSASHARPSTVGGADGASTSGAST